MTETRASYCEQFKAGLYDVDFAGSPKASRLTERMLLAANNHLDLLNWSWEHLYNDIGVCLVLVEVALKITGKIRLGDTMTLTTWTSRRLYPMLMRWFVIEDSHGERVCEAMMNCVLIDVKTRTLTNASKYGLTLVDDETPPKEVTIKRPRFAPKAESFGAAPDFRFSKRVEVSDLDYNGHMNTARYVELVENMLGREWLVENRIKEISVRYEKETGYGETIEAAGFVRNGEEGETIDITGKAGEVGRFSATLRFAPSA